MSGWDDLPDGDASASEDLPELLSASDSEKHSDSDYEEAPEAAPEPKGQRGRPAGPPARSSEEQKEISNKKLPGTSIPVNPKRSHYDVPHTLHAMAVPTMLHADEHSVPFHHYDGSADDSPTVQHGAKILFSLERPLGIDTSQQDRISFPLPMSSGELHTANAVGSVIGRQRLLSQAGETAERATVLHHDVPWGDGPPTYSTYVIDPGPEYILIPASRSTGEKKCNHEDEDDE